MAEATAEIQVGVDQVKGKKGRNNGRRALKQKDPSANEANILAGKLSQISPALSIPALEGTDKENHESLTQPKKTKSKQTKHQQSSFEKEVQDLKEKLQQMRLEKEKTEELLKERDEMLKQKEEELETRIKEQEKLQMELKKLQKMKEFKPTMIFPIVQSLRDKEQEKKEKNKKSSDMKRPALPYARWCKDHWAEVKKANPEAEFKEISNMLGAKWKTISEEEKKPYEEKYQAEKEIYLENVGKEKRENEAMKLLEDEHKQKTAIELLEQYLQFKQEAEKEKTKKKKEKDPLKPKHPMSAFIVYSNERRAALLAQNKTVKEVAKILGEEWKSMTENEKAPFEEMAKKNKDKYVQDMVIYKQKKEEEAENLKKEEDELIKIQKHEALQLLKKKEKAELIIKKAKEKRQKRKKEKEEKNADSNKPKRPASSFLLFSKEARKNIVEERPELNNSTLKALIAVKWKELGAEEKQMWNAKAAEAMEAYKKEMEGYNKSAAAAAPGPAPPTTQPPQ
ncbi:High mobility group box domain, partial [Dillenia turbinata]